MKGLILKNPNRVFPKQTPAAWSVGVITLGLKTQPRSPLPLRGRVRIQHPSTLHPCSDCVHAGSDGLLFQSTPTPLDALLNSKHVNGIFHSPVPLVRDSVLRCAPPVRKRERERTRDLTAQRTDWKEFGNKHRSRCHQDAKETTKYSRNVKTRGCFLQICLHCASNVSWCVSCRNTKRSSRSNIKCHHPLTTFSSVLPFPLLMFFKQKKRKSV